MKKIVSSIIITCMLLMSFCNICYAATFQPTITAESGAVGDTITVTVSLPANTNAAGGSFNLVYDNTKMELIDATAGNILTAFSKTVNKTYAANKVRLNFAGSETVTASGGVALTATFKLTASGTAAFSTEKFKLADIDTNYLTCADSTKNITITSGGTSSAFAPTITAANGTVGDTINVTVSIPANTNAAGGSFNLIYDNTKMELIDATAGDILTAFSKTVNKTYAANKVRLNFAGSETVSASGGVVLNASFKLTAAGTASFSTEKFKLADIDTNYLTCENASKSITITVPSTTVAVTGVSLNKTSTTLTVGGTETLTATVTPTNATNKNVSWTSSNTNVASVSNGVITAKAPGTATITVTTADGSKKATCTVTVNAATVAVTGVSLNKTSTTLTVGGTETLTATVTPSNATNKNVSWTTSNTNVVSVSNGVITAKAAGTATITVTTADGSKKATCTVTVNAPTVAVTGVSLNKTSTTLTVGGTETLTATVTPTNATNKNVSWTSSNTNVASVSNGVVTAKSAGTATITVKTADGNKTATCAVTVNAPVDENTPNIKIVGATGKAGNTVDVVIEISNNPGIAYLGFDLGYNSSVMTLQSVTGNDVFGAADFIAGDLEKNPYTVLAANYTGDKTANGKFVTATFLIKEDCVEGTYEITITNPQAYNIDETEKTFSVTNGVVTVKNVDAGDVTGDGKINGMDLLRLGKHFAGWTVEIDETGADVTGDGKINGMDLLRLGKYFAGWEVKLGK